MRVASLFVLALAELLQGADAADSFNVGIQLYKDSNCFERSQMLLLMEGVCYSNTYSNYSKAYTVKIVDFDPPGKVNVYQYSDNCMTQIIAPKSVQAEQCQQFTGAFHGIYKLMFRGTPCEKKEEYCSKLRIVSQEFFQSATCKGLTTASFSFPLHKECLRFENGTQHYEVSSDMSNITQTDFHGSGMCAGSLSNKYHIQVDRCYPLYGDFAFRWRIDLVDEMAADCSYPKVSGLSTLSLAALTSLHAASNSEMLRLPR